MCTTQNRVQSQRVKLVSFSFFSYFAFCHSKSLDGLLFHALNLKPRVSFTEAVKVETSTLIIGDLSRWRKKGRQTQAFGQCKFSGFAGLNPEMLLAANTDIVLSPLIADSFDAFDVADLLQRAKFQGSYCAIAADNIDPVVVRKDIYQVAPDVNFDVLVIPNIAHAKAS